MEGRPHVRGNPPPAREARLAGSRWTERSGAPFRSFFALIALEPNDGPRGFALCHFLEACAVVHGLVRTTWRRLGIALAAIRRCRPHRRRSLQPGELAARRKGTPAVRDARLLALCLECVVEGDGALRRVPGERQGEEDLLWDSLKHKPRHVLEPEFPVVIGMPDKAASLGIHLFQS